MTLPSLPACSLQVVVEPSQQNLVRSQTEEIVHGLSFLTEPIQLRMKFDIDLCKETSTDDLPDESKDEMFSALGDIG